MRKVEIARALGAASLLTILAATAAARPASAAPFSQASTANQARIAAASTVRQVITVTAASHSTTYATFRAYQVTGTKKVLVFGPWTARVGYNGIALAGRKREGDGKTPSGTYGFSFFFGVDANPGVAFPYRLAYRYDYWDDDSRSTRYNEWVDTRRFSAGAYPEPMHNVPAYDYGAVIAYNTARVPGRGSAIFLHVGTGGDTAGCVSLPAKHLLLVLRWLRPADHPVITIAAR
jgi:L,D-peptidoglycan transpeptidase YkuD (ErfK/YbiS/YcfS/YnhG family)